MHPTGNVGGYCNYHTCTHIAMEQYMHWRYKLGCFQSVLIKYFKVKDEICNDVCILVVIDYLKGQY